MESSEETLGGTRPSTIEEIPDSRKSFESINDGIKNTILILLILAS